MTAVAKLSAAQQRALAEVEREGEVWAYNGISEPTARALHRLGVAVFVARPGSRQYGTLGPMGGRGRWAANWSVRATWKHDQVQADDVQ